MKISFFPFMPCCETGSSRVRVYWLSEYLVKQGIDSHVYYGSERASRSRKDTLNSDILVFQKCYSGYWVNLAKEARKRGVKIILDLVDKYNVDTMHSLTDVVTTDSVGIAEYYRYRNPRIRTHVIEDSTAYLKSPIPPRKHMKRKNLKMAYFVSPSTMNNIKACEKALFELEKRRDYDLVVISGSLNKSSMGSLKYIYWKWSFEKFTELLKRCDFAILPQRWEWKGGNKLVQSITHNLPAVSSNTPAYRRIAEATGTEEFLCDSTEEWLNALEKMFDPDARNEFLAKTIDWVWNNYSMDCIGEQWIKLFKELV